MLTVTFSNRYEALRDALLDSVERTPPSQNVFASTPVIVPSAALQRDVTLAWAARFGLCADVEFSFLAQWLWRQIARAVPGIGSDSPFAPPVLAWRVYEAFGDADFIALHARLRDYLRQADPAMRYDLALRTAGVLEQYLTYRPDWLQAWSLGESVDTGSGPAATPAQALADQAWQAALWRRLVAALGTEQEHPAMHFLRAVAAQQDASQAVAGGRGVLPLAAHVFCLPAMPPLYIRLLRQLGRWTDLRLYVLNPCREYWFEVVDRRRLGYLAVQQARSSTAMPSAAAAPALYHEQGHALLAAWGRQTQSHVDLLFEQTEGAADTVVDDSRFEEPPGQHLLARLQRDILDLVDAEPGRYAVASAAEGAADRSLEIHVCHSLTRELEVLQDQLLALFAGPGRLQPGEVLVAVPDLAAAGPLIDAVFGTVPAARRIPYAITGRPRSALNGVGRALLDLLALAGSRWPVSGLMELLQQPVVGQRFGVTGDDLETVRTWLADSGVHWGLDAAQRESLALPATARHTLDDGLQRLFLGYALPDSGPCAGPADAAAGYGEAFGDLLPAGRIEGDAALLGAFWCFAERLGEWRRRLAAPHTAESWRALLFDLLDQAVAAEGDALDDLREVQDAVRALHAQMTQGGLAAAVPLEVVRTALTGLLDDPARGGVPTGAVTFASMSSLRGLPFRIVCVLGLDDRQFPSTTPPAEFDLMALQRCRGDRQRGTDDRNVFLDLLLAARDRLHLSYTGRSVRDNSALPPSVLIAELIDHLLPRMAADPASPDAWAAARRRLIVEHPLQAFSPDNFHVDADPRRRSFRQDYCEALQQRLQHRPTAAMTPADPSPAPDAMPAGMLADTTIEEETEDDARDMPAAAFFHGPLSAPDESARDLTLAELIRFFRNPCRDLLRRRLGIELPSAEDELQDDEPFVPDLAARRRLAERLLPQLLAPLRADAWEAGKADAAALAALARAGAEFPDGPLGELALADELQGMQQFAQEVRQHSAAPTLPVFSATLRLDAVDAPGAESGAEPGADDAGWTLSAAFTDLRADGLVRWRWDIARARDHLDAWLHHLFLCAAAPPGAAPRTLWLARDGGFALAPVADAHARLGTLLALYRQGQREPLHFFPKAAWQFVDSGRRHAAAVSAWHSTPRHPYGEDADPAYRLALRGVAEPLDAAFEVCADAVFGALPQHKSSLR